ncbi:MAG: SDR family NAD(P)-dependent oxidoreductase [Variovorax sp.]
MTTRRVLITGGGSGIGLATARAFHWLGDEVLISGSRSGLHEIAAGITGGGVPVRAHIADLADEEQTVGLARATMRDLGGCDVLVNCAGYSKKRSGAAIPPTEIETSDWDRTIRINLTAPFVLCRELMPSLVRSGRGRVINIASRGGRTFSAAAGADYSASKAGLIGLTRHLAGTFGEFGVTVNAIAPGRVDTPQAGMSSDAVKLMAKRSIPVGRFGTPEEIAAVVVFLASGEAGFITGACVDANGGAFMG